MALVSRTRAALVDSTLPCYCAGAMREAIEKELSDRRDLGARESSIGGNGQAAPGPGGQL